MDTLDRLQLFVNIRHALIMRAIMEQYGDETCIRNFGDLTVDNKVFRNRLDVDGDDDDNA